MLHLLSTLRMRNVVDFTALSIAQNGHDPLSRVFNEMRSMSPFFPHHIFGSLVGSFPENEKLHSPFTKSTVT